MPVTLSLILSILAAGGLFFSIYAVITLLVGGKRAQASPKMGIAPGDVRGALNIWVVWDPAQFNVQVYRLIFRFASPYSAQKEGIFCVTYENPQTAPFTQVVKIPDRFVDLIKNSNEKFLLSVELKTIEELTLIKTVTSAKLKSIFSGTGNQPEIQNKLPLVEEDKAAVFTLDYSELQVRRKKLRDLEAQAQAKAKAKTAAPAKPAAAPAAPAAPAQATPAPAPATDKSPIETAVKSVRDLVAASNAAKVPVEKP
ncbi:MAG: hypothetical protein ACKN9V_03460 [Pseudomonadota bacterium]